MRIRRMILLLSLGLSLAAPSSAGAAVTLGPDLTPVPGAGQQFAFVAIGCQQAYPSCTFVNLRSANPDVSFATPAAGVITRWGFRAGMGPQATDQTMTLKTFRPGSQDGLFGYAFATAVNSGPSFVIPAGNQLPSDPTMLPARMPIAAGERVGILADNSITFAVYNPTPSVTSTVLFTGFAPYMGEDYGTAYDGTAVALNAVVEPDADGDGFGDETQDCSPSDPTTQACAPGSPPLNLPPPVSPLPIVDPGGKCETACGGGVIFTPPPPPPPAGDGSKFYVALKCPPEATSPCGGFVVINAPAPGKPRAVPNGGPAAPPRALVTLAKTSYEVAPGATENLKLTLSKAGRKLLQKKGKLKVTVTVTPNSGEPVSTSRTLKYKPKKR